MQYTPKERSKAKSGRDLIGKRIETEYEENDKDGNRCYLGWFKGTITGFNERKGHFVEYDAAVREGVVV